MRGAAPPGTARSKTARLPKSQSAKVKDPSQGFQRSLSSGGADVPRTVVSFSTSPMYNNAQASTNVYLPGKHARTPRTQRLLAQVGRGGPGGGQGMPPTESTSVDGLVRQRRDNDMPSKRYFEGVYGPRGALISNSSRPSSAMAGGRPASAMSADGASENRQSSIQPVPLPFAVGAATAEQFEGVEPRRRSNTRS